MSWIALKMLTGDKAKFFGIVLGLTFAALLITQQGSIFCGLMRRTAGQVEDITGADLWVMDHNVRYIDDVKPMIESSLYRVRGVDGVEWAVPLYKGIARAKINARALRAIPDEHVRAGDLLEVIEQVILLGLDDVSLVGAPPPERMVAGSLRGLRQPDAIVIDDNRLFKLFPGDRWDLKDRVHGKRLDRLPGPTRDQLLAAYPNVPLDERGRINFFALFLGRELEMNDHRALIVGVCQATRTFQSNAIAYTTYSRAKQYVPRERKVLSYILARTDFQAPARPEPPTGLAGAWARFADVPRVVRCALRNRPSDPVEQAREDYARLIAGRIARQTGLKARTSQQFLWDTMAYYFKYTGIPINFGITALLGFIVGTAIAGQTFYNFTIENLKQFGSLKAMGTTNLRIVGMIVLQAMVVGLLGYGLGTGLAALFAESPGVKGGELAYFTWWPVLVIAGLAVVLICILSSVLCVRRVIVLEPAVVFRG